MKKITTILTIVASIIILDSCSTTKKETVSLDIPEKSKHVYKDANTISNFEQGKSIYEDQCSLCHEPKNIEDYSMAQWQEIVPDMVARVNKKMKSEEIDPTEEQILFNYIEKVHP